MVTEAQIEKINKHLERMTESQQDVYIQKLEEAGVIQNILSKFGSPSSNIKKLQKQKASIIKQLDGMIKAIGVAKPKGVTVEQKQADIKALTDLKQKVMNINMNVQLDDAVAQPEANNVAQK
jgi:EAL domain-containing protein (putative c-di-GMP-specific phosphodiesterase class I)